MRARLPGQDQARGLGPAPGRRGSTASRSRTSCAARATRRRGSSGSRFWRCTSATGRRTESSTPTTRRPPRPSAPRRRTRRRTIAVATTGLPEHLREPAALEAFFEGVFERPARRRARRAVPPPERGHARGGEGRGRRAAAAERRRRARFAAARDAVEAADAAAAPSSMLKAAGAAPAAVAEAEARRESLKDKAARALKGLFGGGGGARGRVQAFCEALKEVERAEWRQALHERWEGKERQRFQRGCAKCIDGCICCCSFVGRKIQNAGGVARGRAAPLREGRRKPSLTTRPGVSGRRVGDRHLLEPRERRGRRDLPPRGAGRGDGVLEADVPRGQAAPETGKAQPLDRDAGDGGILLNGVAGLRVPQSKPVPMEVTPLPEPRDIVGSSSRRSTRSAARSRTG